MSSIAIDTHTLSTQAISQPSREQRYQELVTVYMKDLFRYAYWLTGDKSVSDDLVQETMLRAWRSLDKLQKPAAAKGWLITILRRENARRFERFQPKLSAIPTEDLGDPHQYYDTSTDAFILRQAITELPQKYRDPLLLQVIHGYSQKEIAKELGISVAGAGTRLFRARKKMRALLED